MERKEIERKANELLSQYKIEIDNGVEIVDLCNKLGFTVVPVRLDDTEDGFIVANDSIGSLPGFKTNKLIVVNSKRNYEDKRFIIAHELGHYVLREDKQTVIAARDSSHGRSEKENNIDYFAACLLMPKEAFVRQCKRLEDEGITIVSELVTKLATIFNVPMLSALRRMQETDLLSEKNP